MIMCNNVLNGGRRNGCSRG